MKGPVVVLDATHGVGRALVQAAVDAGQPVIAVSSDQAALKQLIALFPHADLTPVLGTTADESASGALAAALRNLGRPLAGIVVPMHHKPTRGRVIEQSTDVLRRTLNDELLPHLAAARALVPLLAESGRNGSYVVIGGPGSEQPWAGYGHRSISAAATRMLLRVLHDEAHALSVRVQMLSVEMPARTDENSASACTHWPSALGIAERALALVNQSEPHASTLPIVRYAWNSLPPLPGPREAGRRRKPRPPAPIATASRPDTDPPHTPDDSSPLPNLDDTWALLKPLLSMNH